jgi:hypothetical protein
MPRLKFLANEFFINSVALLFIPPAVESVCAPAAANRSLRATSQAELALGTLFHSSLAATEIFLAQVFSKKDTTHRHRTTEL